MYGLHSAMYPKSMYKLLPQPNKTQNSDSSHVLAISVTMFVCTEMEVKSCYHANIPADIFVAVPLAILEPISWVRVWNINEVRTLGSYSFFVKPYLDTTVQPLIIAMKYFIVLRYTY